MDYQNYKWKERRNCREIDANSKTKQYNIVTQNNKSKYKMDQNKDAFSVQYYFSIIMHSAISCYSDDIAESEKILVNDFYQFHPNSSKEYPQRLLTKNMYD